MNPNGPSVEQHEDWSDALEDAQRKWEIEQFPIAIQNKITHLARRRKTLEDMELALTKEEDELKSLIKTIQRAENIK